ncbi:MAG: DctP family TRAP transporter solute-binding subunit [Brooklawnia sp.]|jgi:tripartite ATP-independent transporter DctP family solute receptor
MSFKKLGISLISALALVSLAACGGSSDADPAAPDETGAGVESLSLSLGHSYGIDSLQNRAAERYAEQVEEASGGAVQIQVYPSSQLGSWEEMQEGLEIGTVDILIESVGTLERYTPRASIEGVPFLYEDTDHLFEVWDSELGQEILDVLEDETGFKLIGGMYFGQRILNTSRPIESLDDLAGLKLRVPPQQTYIDTWAALGASPTPMSLNEVFSAIEQGVVEGQENPVDVARFDSFYEVAPYITNTSHLMGNFHFQMWGASFDGYSSETQELLLAQAEEVSAWYREAALEEEDENIAFLEENGVTFFDVDRSEWRERVLSVYDGLDPQVASWVEEIQGMGGQ